MEVEDFVKWAGAGSGLSSLIVVVWNFFKQMAKFDNYEKRLANVEKKGESFVSEQILDLKQQKCQADIAVKLASFANVKQTVDELRRDVKENKKETEEHFQNIGKVLNKIAIKLKIEEVE
jgi:tetrahydromethanopterin S-methyltransferase subunit G